MKDIIEEIKSIKETKTEDLSIYAAGWKDACDVILNHIKSNNKQEED